MRQFDGNGHYRQVASSSATPVDVQYSAIQAEMRTLVPVTAIRESTRRWAAHDIDFTKVGSITLRAINTHDQAVDIILNVMDQSDLLDKAGALVKFTIPANKSYVTITPTDWPILGSAILDPLAIGLQCAVAPTTGTIEVKAYVTPII